MNGSYITSDRNYDSRSRKEALINSLKHCKIAQQDRIFYMENPEAWDWDKSSHLNVGVKAVLSNSNYSSTLWVESGQQLAMFKRIKSKYRAIERAEKAAEEFKKSIDRACNSDDLSFMLCILQADERAEEIGDDLEQAYHKMGEACQDNKDVKVLSELITNNIMAYIDYQNLFVYLEITDKVLDLKKQIIRRKILEAPKFGSW